MARLLKSLIRFTVYSIHPIKMKLRRMIEDISPHNRTASDFLIHSSGRCWVAPLETFKSIGGLQYSIIPIERKLSNMIVDIIRHNFAAPVFSISFQEVLLGARLLRSS